MMHVCGYCRAEFATETALIAHDDSMHGRRDRLLSERNYLNNQFGRGPVIDGRLRDRIAEIDEMLAASQARGEAK
jgi:hypothetical protein